MYKISHLTSVHPRYDTRIFLKECSSLAAHGFTVSLIVADGKGDEKNNNVAIFDVGASEGRLDRMLNAPSRIMKKAVELDADIYHLHDPELIPIGLKLKKLGKKVIFDAHEDIPKQILGKHYLKKHTKLIISNAFSIYERWAFRKFDAIISATPFIREKYLAMNMISVDINNYPILGELNIDEINWLHKKNQVCYVGAITRVRGIHEMVQAMAFVNSETRFSLGGSFNHSNFEKDVKAESGWKKVDELGWLDRNEIRETLSESVAGLVTLHPIINYLDSLPVKMFEYMAAGIPVIASNFPLWKEIIEENQCGLCVDPLNPSSIAEAIDYIIANPNKAASMGKNGQIAVEEKYNWGNEEAKLISLYRTLFD